MQTPEGHAVNAVGQFTAADWWAVIFNPSFPYRLVHMVLAAYLTTAFAVGAVGAFHLLRDAGNAGARMMFSMAMWMAALVAPVQILAGDMHGLNTLAPSPPRLEGHFETRRGQPLVLLGWPDMATQTTRYALQVPRLGSLTLTHDWDGEVRGLKSWQRQDWPNSPLLFWSFRIMVAMGVLMVLTGAWSLWSRWRRRRYDGVWLGRLATPMGPSGFIAVLAGWITTEAGRQPYTVYGLMRTAQPVSPIDAQAVPSPRSLSSILPSLVPARSLFCPLDGANAAGGRARHRGGPALARGRHRAGAGT